MEFTFNDLKTINLEIEQVEFHYTPTSKNVITYKYPYNDGACKLCKYHRYDLQNNMLCKLSNMCCSEIENCENCNDGKGKLLLIKDSFTEDYYSVDEYCEIV